MSPPLPRLDPRLLPDGLRISRANDERPLCVQHAPQGGRPWLHPVARPDLKGTVTENAPAHHPWQHGIYCGLNAIDGVNYWIDDTARDGAQKTLGVQLLGVRPHEVTWRVCTDWINPAGVQKLADMQEWTLCDFGSALHLDLSWTLHAPFGAMFEKYPYGGLFVRAPFRGRGNAVNDAGRQGAEAEGARSRWMRLSVPLSDRHDAVGAELLVFDHPSNPRHPAYWRVDGELGIGPALSREDSFRLSPGEAVKLRYRICISNDPFTQEDAESHWAHFSATP